MAKERSAYVSYLLRLWRASGDEDHPGEGRAVWRASLESPHTGERIGFASLEELFEFLRRQTGVVSDMNKDRDGTKA